MQGATVTAGRVLRSRTEGKIRAAGKLLAAMHASSPVAIDGPTPERIVQPGADFELGEAIRSVEITKGGQRQTEEIRTPRVRVGEDPFTRMLQRGELDPGCEDTNKALGAAGLRYRRLRERAGSIGLQSQDFSRGFTTNHRDSSGRTDDALEAVTWWTRARSSVAPEMWAALDGIVLDGEKPDAVGATLSRYADPKRCSTAALTLLRAALSALDRHFAWVDLHHPDAPCR